MSKIEVYKYRKQNNLIRTSGQTIMSYRWMIFHYNDDKTDRHYGFVEWVDDDYVIDQSDYFDQTRLHMLKRDIQSEYRQILDKKYINNLLRNIYAKTAKEALMYNSEGYEWSSE